MQTHIYSADKNNLPPLLAGPIVRHCDSSEVNFWFVTSQQHNIHCQLINKNTQDVLFDSELTDQLKTIEVGSLAFINLVTINLSSNFLENTTIEYNFSLIIDNKKSPLINDITQFCYPDNTYPNFIISSSVRNLLHGSCRKPHFASKDGLATIDDILHKTNQDETKRPSHLMMTGDQVYCDDVAGPTLLAIKQVIEMLGLYDENIPSNDVSSTSALFKHPKCFYQRESILPTHNLNAGFISTLLSGKPQPVFTSVNAKNHLISLSEVFAMYFLVWSPTLWKYINLEDKSCIPSKFHEAYDKELIVMNDFITTLPQVQRALAHIPCYMIFDDHDVTDDWNLTRGWEEAAYNNPLSNRIIGNALTGYYLCQGWGNAPKKFNEIHTRSQLTFTKNGIVNHDTFIQTLYDFEQWHYALATSPKIVVLDTRTQRWRSESNPNKPSGLMDWEPLCALQLELIGEKSVIMVSPAPIYGVKLIEAVQRVFTFFGKPLAVDAENWMAHSGTANVILNIFRHYKTPPNFIILSGDVHYSFVYRITHRFIKNSSTILQVTCSGIKNEFPSKFLTVLERLNYWLYGRYSPLNWFTKRRRMKVHVKKPSLSAHHSLYNGSGIGLLTIDSNQKATAEIKTVSNETVTFK